MIPPSKAMMPPSEAIMPPSEALSPVKGKVSVFYKKNIYFIEAHAVKSVQTTFEISLSIVSNLPLKVVDFTFLAETVHVSYHPKLFKSAPSLLDIGFGCSCN